MSTGTVLLLLLLLLLCVLCLLLLLLAIAVVVDIVDKAIRTSCRHWSDLKVCLFVGR
jgi:hypothetical protein